ncbi:hypothetical protein PoB_001618400 [Plakobranchus ocellatus]|uniref:Uncharacterized protein n=1 Tax=Plakobranchus ocellatus TaxID=259542 RepID=A0AAV3Z6Q8_9GAST|nr:hypothetical protein PoB_001618400 [Plakobranchus ocellatus]
MKTHEPQEGVSIVHPRRVEMPYGPPSGQGAGGRVRTRDKRVAADLRADLLASVPPTPLKGERVNEDNRKRPNFSSSRYSQVFRLPIKRGHRCWSSNPCQNSPSRSQGWLASYCAANILGH